MASQESSITSIDMLRHGEPEGGRMYRGSGTDHPLSERGWQQMQQSVEGLSGWSVIVTSPMLRCCKFAEHLGQQLKAPVHIEERFLEAGYGAWEGMTPEQVKQEFAQAYWDFYADPINKRPAGSERLEHLNERVMRAFDEVMQQYQGETVLIVSHAGVMRAVMGNILEMPMASQQKINIPYAGMYQVIAEPRGVRISLR